MFRLVRALARVCAPEAPEGWYRVRRRDAAALKTASHLLVHADAVRNVTDVGLVLPGRSCDLPLPIPVLLPPDRPDAVAGAFLATGRPAATVVGSVLDLVTSGDLIRLRWRAHADHDALDLEIERRGRLLVLALDRLPSGTGLRRGTARTPSGGADILPFRRHCA